MANFEFLSSLSGRFSLSVDFLPDLGDGDGGGKSAGGGGKSKSGGDDGFIPNDLSSDPCWTLLTWNMKYCFAKLFNDGGYGNTGCGVFKRGVQN